jgi:hypothetical protein
MLNTDPKRPLVRIIATLAGLAIFGWGLEAFLWQRDLHYKNWFGELIFAPFAILFGLAMILSALLKPEILGSSPTRLKR